MTTTKVQKLPERSEVLAKDTWDLASLYPDDATWKTDFERWESQIAGYAAFRGQLAQSAEKLADCLRFDSELDRLSA